MTLRNLPAIEQVQARDLSIDWTPPDEALERWTPDVQAAANDAATITVYDVIGDLGNGEGVTARRVGGALRAIGNRDVVVNINSPGGDFFEGVAIYNMLREHPRKVTTQVIGEAASAASIIAFAGDVMRIASGGFMMIHNTRGLVLGDRNDLMAWSKNLGIFDQGLAEVYAQRSGVPVAAVAKMMDAETWFSGQAAIDQNMADELLASDQVRALGGKAKAKSDKVLALRKTEAALANHGHSRKDRRRLLNAISEGKPEAAPNVMPEADSDWTAAATLLTAQLKKGFKES